MFEYLETIGDLVEEIRLNNLPNGVFSKYYYFDADAGKTVYKEDLIRIVWDLWDKLEGGLPVSTEDIYCAFGLGFEYCKRGIGTDHYYLKKANRP